MRLRPLVVRATRGRRIGIDAARRRRLAPPIRFVLLTPGRSGSRLLFELLDSHPDVAVTDDFEPLRRPVGHPVRHLFAQQVIAAGTDSRAWGFSVQPAHLSRHGITDAAEWVRRLHDRGIRPMTLVRSNPVARALSVIVASETRNWHFYDERPEARTEAPVIAVDGRELTREIVFAEDLSVAVRAMVQERSHLQLVYEDDLATGEAQQETLQRIFDYLELRPCPVSSSMVRRSTPYSELIANWDEVTDLVRSTRWAGYLSDL